jgi:flagellar basal-body rod modification protein FlgD
MIMATNAVHRQRTAAASSATHVRQPNAAGSEDRFLKLLVAQLNNQDPMNPMDNAQMTSQMAQISTVTGIQQVNQAIKGLPASWRRCRCCKAARWSAADVLVDGQAAGHRRQGLRRRRPGGCRRTA